MKCKKRCILGILAAAWLCLSILAVANPAAAFNQASTSQTQEDIAYYSNLCLSAGSTDADWNYSDKDAEVLTEFYAEFDDVSDEGVTKRTAQALGFFDWLSDLFGWVDDNKDTIKEVVEEVTGVYSEEGIPNDPYTSSKYGMNLHDVDTMTVEDYKRTLSYAGTWVRISISTDEVADQNWSYRLEPFLTNLQTAADELGVETNIVINLSGYSNTSGAANALYESLSWEEKASRYESLAYSLATQVHSMGHTDVIFESWNEPDNDEPGVDLGIGVSPDSDEFVNAITLLNNGFSSGIKQAHGITAFSPFMTLNEEKYDLVKEVWLATESGFDYFSFHYYDDEPGKARYYAEETVDYLANRPVIATEHGYQHHMKDTSYYRRQAWALDQGFTYQGSSTLKGIMNYVYGSNHAPWVIGDNEDFFWRVTHDSKPTF